MFVKENKQWKSYVIASLLHSLGKNHYIMWKQVVLIFEETYWQKRMYVKCGIGLAEVGKKSDWMDPYMSDETFQSKSLFFHSF